MSYFTLNFGSWSFGADEQTIDEALDEMVSVNKGWKRVGPLLVESPSGNVLPVTCYDRYKEVETEIERMVDVEDLRIERRALNTYISCLKALKRKDVVIMWTGGKTLINLEGAALLREQADRERERSRRK